MAAEKSKVLCLDADSVNRVLVSVQLENRYDVILVENTKEANQVLGITRPDLILADVKTMASDGFALFTQLREDAELHTIPVVLLSHVVSDEDRSKALASGAADLLKKPIEAAELLDAVSRHMKSGADSVGGQLTEAKLHLLDFNQFLRALQDRLEVSPEKAIQLSDARPSDLNKIPTLLGIRRAELASHIADYLGVRFVPQVDPNSVLLGVLPTKYCEIHDVLATNDLSVGILFVLSNPFDLEIIDILFRRVRKGDPVHFGIAEPDTIRRLLNTPLFDDEPQPIIAELPKAAPAPTNDVLMSAADEAPVVRMVNKILAEAISIGASDIHIEPRKDDVRLRYRIDGMLHDKEVLPGAAKPGIVSRIKVLSGLDISERRLPQDGRAQVVFDGRQVDIRVSTLPSRHGETVVCRILDQAAVPLGLDDLGFAERSLKMLLRGLEAPHGIILVTGPTGSGKTTTLYSALRGVCTPDVSVVTVEDPIEYDLPSVKQVQVHAEIGMTFPAALRSILRQDPDVVMIGEMRDRETVDVALKAAMTGHLVISTLHTNDAPSTVSRLVGMGLEPYMLAGALEMICAQRLVRKLCKHCKQPETLTPEVIERLQLPTGEDIQYYTHKGCEQCNNTGFKGRMAVIEILLMNEELRLLVARNVSSDELRREALRMERMVTLRDSAMEKAREGTTTLAEVLQVTG
ncbi:MAG: ATPase, T2SS/T4P/T4SS family [Nitrospirota bacterium]|nr:ATPase, T2SS/T4P/T4SS family [Nitrospirota bacterium]